MRGKIMRMLTSVLILAALVCFTTPAAPGIPDAATSQRIARLIAQLDDDDFDKREEASAALRGLGEVAEPFLQRVLDGKPSPEVRQRVQTLLAAMRPLRYPAHSNGWSWVYESIAHGQSFKAAGTDVQSLHLRVARLNANAPAAPLTVEIRDPKLEKIYAVGGIAADQAGQNLEWREVRWQHRAPLVEGASYYLVFHSQKSNAPAPWVVNEVYSKVYPDGVHLGYEFDFFFRLSFGGTKVIHVGPDLVAPGVTPINSGNTGGTNVPGPLSLTGVGAVPQGTVVRP
jgi:hypothetical protein